MKNKNFYTLTLNIGAAITISLFLSSCVKEQPAIVSNPTYLTAVNYIQGSPGQPDLDVFANSTKVTATPLSYAANTKYTIVPAGIDSTVFKNHATGATVYSTTVNLLPNGTYSLFLANKVSSPEVVIIPDTLAPPSYGNTSLRFINLSPDAPAVDLVVKGGATLTTNKSYKNYTSFQELKGNLNYTLEIHQTGTGTLLASIPNVKLESGFLYTVWLRGLVANTSTADQLTLDMITSAYFY